MKKELDITSSEYQTFVEECRAIITERVFRSRMEIIEGKWELGKLVKENPFSQNVRRLGQDIGISHTELYACINFFEKYPSLEDFLSKQNKNISWTKIEHELLPENPKPESELWICPT